MKQLYKTIALLFIGIALLSGCGTNEATEKPGKNTPSHEQNETGSSGKQTNTETVRPSEKKLSYQKDGKAYEETAYLKTSENQSFSLYVLEGWELEAEEPNSDVLLKDDLFVRIRLIEPEGADVDYGPLVKDQATAVSPDAALQNTDNLEGMLHQAVWYKAYTNDTAVNVIWIKQGVPMIVMIQTPRNQEQLEPIFAMLETLEKVKASKPKESSGNPDEPVSSPAAPQEKTVTYTVNGQKKQEKGSLYESTNQPFRAYVLPGYQADAVEPHLDRLYLKADESYYMDVEWLAPEAAWNDVQSETVQKLKEINESVAESTWNEDGLLHGAAAYRAESSDVWAQAFLLQPNGSRPGMRITIYMPNEDAARFAEFLAMANTIAPK